MTLSTPQRRPRILPLFAAITLALVAGPFINPAPAPAAPSSVEQIGVLERFPADARQAFGDSILPRNFLDPAAPPGDLRNTYGGNILVFPEVRQMWQMFPKGEFHGGTFVAVRDLDSLRIVHTMYLTGNFATNRLFEYPHAIDPGKRVFLIDDTFQKAFEIDLRTFATRVVTIAPINFNLASAWWAGATYDATSDSLMMLYGQVAASTAANTNTFLTRVDLKTGAFEIRLLRSCNGPLPSADVEGKHSTRILTTPDSLYIPCMRAGVTGIVVRVPRAEAFAPNGQEDVAVGPVQFRESLIDPTAKRIYMGTSPGELWAFDAETMSFVGVVATLDSTSRFTSVSHGIDTETGRVFFLSKGFGFGVVEARFFPMPQPRTYPTYKSVADEQIWSDPKTGRVWALRGNGGERALAYEVFQAGTAPRPPPPPDADANTTDRDEQPGLTDVRYFANGSGYGARVILANGVIPVVPAPSVASVAPTAQVLADHISPKCGFSDRELIAGRVNKAEYDTGSTAAQAASVFVDDRTKLDLDRPSRCDVTVRNGAEVFRGVFATAPAVLDNQNADNPRWTIKPASCSASEGGDTEKAESDDAQTRLGTSKVACPTPGGTLEANAFASLVGGVSVGKAYSDVKIFRDGKNGMKSTVVSAAEDINIAAGLIRIAEIRSVAESVSNGRPKKGKEMSTHSVLIRGVRVNGQEICRHDQQCDPNAVLDALNRVASGRAQFRIASGLDKRLLKGTDKGALTAVQKSVQRQSSDQALIGDFTTDVPALEMVVYNDNAEWGRARQLYQFAGVASSATYNISLIPSGTAGPDFEPDPDSGLGISDGSGPQPFLSTGEAGTPPAPKTETSKKRGVLDFISDAVNAVGRGIRLFFIDPRQSLLLLTGWALFASPGWLARRRRALVEARAE
jgi:hypothetical protein